MSTAPPRGSVAVLTGAGISAESGLSTFRGAGGLWEGHRAEEVAHPRAWARDPVTVRRFYEARRVQAATFGCFRFSGPPTRLPVPCSPL